MEWMIALVILACFGVGKYYQNYSEQVDAPAEQAAEMVLKKYNIDEDFSAGKKKKIEEVENVEKKD